MNILGITNDSTINYQRSRTKAAPDTAVSEERKDVFISDRGKSGKVSKYVGPSTNTRELSDEQAKELASRYDVTNMNNSEFRELVNELRKSHVLSLEESRMGTAGEKPFYRKLHEGWTITKEDPMEELQKWPTGNGRANFVSLMDSYGKYCKSFADHARSESADDAARAGDDYSDYYSHLHRIMQKIANAKAE